MIHGQVDVPCADLFIIVFPRATETIFFRRILEASAAGEISAYILCPAVVHGPSSGPVGHASIFFRMYLETVLKEKGPFIVEDGMYRVEIVRMSQIFGRHIYLI